MDLADLVVVNKADIDPAAAARAVGQIESALHLVSGRSDGAWTPRVLATSALAAAQVAAVWSVVESFRAAQAASGAGLERRRGQARAWLWERIDAGLRHSFNSHPDVRAQLAPTLAAIESGAVPVSVAARRLLASAGIASARDTH